MAPTGYCGNTDGLSATLGLNPPFYAARGHDTYALRKALICHRPNSSPPEHIRRPTEATEMIGVKERLRDFDHSGPASTFSPSSSRSQDARRAVASCSVKYLTFRFTILSLGM